MIGPAARRFKIGKYDIVAQPAPGSAHMLRYTVMLNGKRLGALMSVPTESDCKFLEKPPVVPPLKIFHLTNRPGRPKKGSRPPAQPESRTTGLPREELPADVAIGLGRTDR